MSIFFIKFSNYFNEIYLIHKFLIFVSLPFLVYLDCVFINTDDSELGMHSLSVARTKLFFAATVDHVKYSCALVHWYYLIGDSADECTGMWVVKPDILDDGMPWTAVIHLDSIVRLAHLLPIYGEE